MRKHRLIGMACLAAAVLLLALGVSGARAANITWSGGGDGVSWSDTNNWTGNVLPGVNDNVTIGAVTGNPTIQITATTGLVQIESLTSSEPLIVFGGTLQVAGTVQTSSTLTVCNSNTFSNNNGPYSSGIIKGGTYTTTGNGVLDIAGGTLDGVTFDSGVGVTEGATIVDGITLNARLTFIAATDLIFAGTQMVSGTGEVYFQGSGAMLAQGQNNTQAGAATLTIGPGITVDGGDSYGTIGNVYLYDSFVNQGTVTSDTEGETIFINISGTVTNGGTMNAVNGGSLEVVNLVDAAGLSVSGGGTLTLDGNWTNTGTLTATGSTLSFTGSWNNTGTINITGSTLNLGGAFTFANLGTVNRNASSVNITGTLNNTGQTLNLNGATGGWTLASGGDIKGGTVNTTSGGSFTLSSGYLDGVTLMGNVTSSGAVTIVDGLTVDGILTIPTAYLLFLGSQTINGTGEVFLGESGQIIVQGANNTPAGAAVLTFGPDLTVDGGGDSSHSITGNFAFDSIVNQGTISADVSGHAINMTALSVTNLGSISAVNGGTLGVTGTFLINGEGALNGSTGGLFQIANNLLGNTTAVAASNPQATLQFNGSGTSGSPQLFEAMSDDEGNVTAGFTQNFAYGEVALANNTYVQLVDQSHNSTSTGTDAVYAQSVVVPAGCTLDLNGLHLYARGVQVSGAVLNGTILQTPSAGTLTLGTQTVGNLATAGQVDDWTFYGYAGHSITVALDPGSAAVLSPELEWASVELLDSNNNVLASGSDTSAGGLLTLSSIVLPANGTYTIQVAAAAAETSSTGYYLLGAYDVTGNVYSLNVGQPSIGKIVSPSAVDQWNFTASAGEQVQLDKIGASSPSIAFELSGSGGYIAFQNLTGNSGFVDLPDSGTYTVTVSGLNGATGSYGFQLNETSVTALALGTPYNGTWSGSGQAQLFSIPVTASNPLTIALTDAAVGDHTEIYARFGAPPTRSTYDFGQNGPGASHTLVVPNANVGTWYVLVYGESIPSPPDTYTLEATTSDSALTSVSTTQGAANTNTTFTLTGAGFASGSTVSLVSSSGTFAASSFTVDSPTQITTTFAAGTVPAGTYNIVVTQADGSTATLDSPVTIVAEGEGVLATSLEIPNPIGRHSPSILYVDYSNTGTAAMAAPLLMLTATNPNGPGALMTLNGALQTSGYWTSASPNGYSQTIEILASGATPGVLAPGESKRVPVYYAGWIESKWDLTNSRVNFNLGSVKAGDTTPFDWASQESAFQPAGISGSAWNIIYGSLLTTLGNTAGGMVQLLDNEASYLAQLGQDPNSVPDLWNMAVTQAGNVAPSATLAPSSDLSLSGGANLSLDFDRAFNQTIPGRFTAGPLGFGWYHAWQASLSLGGDGTVTVSLGNGTQLSYQPDSRTAGAYFSEPGDTSKLTAIADGYDLTALDGTVMFFNSNGTLGSVQSPSGDTVTLSYGSGRLTGVAGSSGRSLALSYNSAGLISSVTDSSNRTTTYAYDASNQYLMSVTSFAGRTTFYTYNTTAGSAAQNSLASVDFPDGTHRYFTYDSQGRLASSYADGNAMSESFGYTGGRVDVTDATSDTFSEYYDLNNQLGEFVDALGNPTYFSHDASFNLIQVSNASGGSFTLTYNNLGQPTSATDFLGNTSLLTYGAPQNQLSTFTDPEGNTTQETYNAAGSLISTLYPNSSSESYSYDSLGNLASFVNAAGQTTACAVNGDGHPTSIGFFDGSQYAYNYDGEGKLIAAIDSSGTTTITYDPVTRAMTRIAYPNGKFLTFNYDSAGRRTQMAASDGYTVKYTYNTTGLLGGLTDGSNNSIVTFAYDANGRVSQKTYGNGTFTAYQYDANGKIVHLINNSPGASVSSRFDYTYNALGQAAAEATLSGTWSYTYDANSRLIHAVFAAGSSSGASNQDLLFNYDANGNRTSTVINGVTTPYVVDNMNRYTSVGGAAYTYDANGNLLSDGTNAYGYNALNRLVSVSTASGTTSYFYGALGQELSSMTGGITTQNLVDPIVPGGIVVGTYDSLGNLLSHYTYGLGLMSQVTVSGSSYFDFDDLGNTAGITNSAGNYSNSYGYLPFGDTQFASGSTPNPFRFAGQLGIPTTGNVSLMGLRGYTSSIGRFTGMDPLRLAASDSDLYSFCFNQPTGMVDPRGTTPVVAGAAIGAVVGGASYLISNLGPGGDGGSIPGFATAIGVGALAGGATTLFPLLLGGGVVDVVGNAFFSGVVNGTASVIQTAANGGSAPQAISAGIHGAIAGAIFGGAGVAGGIIGKFGGTAISAGAVGIDTGFEGGISALSSYIAGIFGGSSSGVESTDPNELYGPAGYGVANYVTDMGNYFAYRVTFENSPTASAPAQSVTLTDNLNPNLDWSTFQLTGIGFGDTNIVIPPGSQHFETTVQMTYNGQTFNVQIEAGIHTATGQVYAIFQSIDPNTGLPPANVLTGFLPPEDGTGRGEGYLTYTVSPNADIAAGTQISNVANIVFDSGEPIPTDLVNDEYPSEGIDPTKEATVTIDSIPPVSRVAALPPVSPDSFWVYWSGTDNLTGIAGYTIYVSDDDGASWTAWLSNTTETAAIYFGQPGKTYAFYSIATDGAGNVEAKTVADAGTETTTGTTIQASVIVAKNDPAPGVSEAKFLLTDNPAVDTYGDVSFKAFLSGLAKKSPINSGNNSGIWFYTGTNGTLVARTGTNAAGTSGARFSGLSDPAMHAEGSLAFVGALTGGDVLKNKSNATGVWLAGSGTTSLIARSGAAAVDETGATYDLFSQIVTQQASDVAFLATLTGKSVTLASNLGLWGVDLSGTTHSVIRTDESITAGGSQRKIKSLNVFGISTDEQGQSRSVDTLGGQLAFGLTFTDKSAAICTATPLSSGFDIESVEDTLDTPVPGVADTKWSAFGNPAVNENGTVAFRGTLLSTSAGTKITASNNTGIWLESDSTTALVALTGSSAPGLAGSEFARLLDPVLNNNDQIAFIGSLKPTGSLVTVATSEGIWESTSGTTSLVAREGATAAGVTGGKFAAFDQVVLPDVGGPIFLAKLTGVKANMNTGLWSIDAEGQTHLLVQTGDVADVHGISKVIKSFSIFTVCRQVVGQSRNFDAGTRTVAFLATFSDGTWAILQEIAP